MPELDEIDNVFEEVVDLAKKIILKVDNDDLKTAGFPQSGADKDGKLSEDFFAFPTSVKEPNALANFDLFRRKSSRQKNDGDTSNQVVGDEKQERYL
ncbi:hypothetical protein TNCV_536171 [Trichonephila clavipes]|nr:hypothetical protein TNCV_536171 [Trichonephila clavipes]